MEKLMRVCSPDNNSYRRITKLNKGENDLRVAVPKGCLPIYVGEECKRYIVPLKLLPNQEFQELLKQSYGEELELEIEGPIKLSCTTERFQEVLNQFKRQHHS